MANTKLILTKADARIILTFLFTVLPYRSNVAKDKRSFVLEYLPTVPRYRLLASKIKAAYPELCTSKYNALVFKGWSGNCADDLRDNSNQGL